VDQPLELYAPPPATPPLSALSPRPRLLTGVARGGDHVGGDYVGGCRSVAPVRHPPLGPSSVGAFFAAAPLPSFGAENLLGESRCRIRQRGLFASSSHPINRPTQKPPPWAEGGGSLLLLGECASG
jgi:hypothetical protein